MPHRPRSALVIGVFLCSPRLQRDGKVIEFCKCMSGILKAVVYKRKQKLALCASTDYRWNRVFAQVQFMFFFHFFSAGSVICLATNYISEARQTLEHISKDRTVQDSQ